ncbi:fibronectin type III domain-containing protein [Zooshikella ganghwensis]|uniref:pectate lyase n=1 Tax=Zooshikella ganghwensis TaxID=202772 RepID=A0A4V1INX6_9GAMM|nr:fibronectin type III domain-containing protein [Zooshikella ganghwensis]RDH45261.1 hypothetical protein B9G39_18420 [Zooshikella ganghwensis]
MKKTTITYCFLTSSLGLTSTVQAAISAYSYDENARLTTAVQDQVSSYDYVYDSMGNQLVKYILPDQASYKAPELEITYPEKFNKPINPAHPTLSWNIGEKTTPVVFDLYLGEENPPKLYRKGLSSSEVRLEYLKGNSQYFWKIIARDHHNQILAETAISELKTLNNPPSAPTNIKLTKLDSGYQFSWGESEDPDLNDFITGYEFYFGEIDKAKISYKTEKNSLSLDHTFEPDTPYAWYVKAADNHGTSSIPSTIGGAVKFSFENNKYKSYYWHHHGGPLWVLDQTKASQGKSSFRTPLIKGGQKTYLETEIYSSGGPLRFDYLLSPHVGNWLELRVDGKQWLSQWSPETEKGFTTFERYLEPGRHVIKWTFKKDGRYNKSEGFVWLDNIFLPAPSDSDQDGAADGWEYRFFDSLDADLSTDPDNDGLTSIEEAKCHCTPHLRDGDRDGMPDPWEFKHQLDPRDKDDALLDSDGDGVLNVDEYLIASNPQVAEEGLVALREDFEKPKRNYYWHHHGGPLWVLDQTKASQGKSSFRTPLIKGGQKTYLETEIYSSGGPLRFDYLLSPHVGNWLELRVDGKQWLSQWSPETEKGFTTFERYLEPGRHVIKWTFKKDGRYNKSEGFVWLDNIFLPAPSDSDQDGAADGWEYRFFDSLDADLSTDPDNDGLTSIEEAKCHCTPHLRDGDRDGMPDPWEFKHQLDPRDKDDALLDSDGDGVLNVDEYLIASNPQVAEEGLVALREDFEKPKRNYYWHHHGGPLWVLDQTKASQGKSSFRTPLIKGGQKTYLETEIYSSGGPLRFDYLLSPHVGNWLELRVDGKQWLSQWSPETEKGFTTFERYLEPGRHVIKWTFKKDGRYNKSEGFVWLDNIFLPAPSDSDQDGAADGWEYRFFDSLDADLSTDPDNDGLTSIEEAKCHCTPHLRDGDRDGMPDPWEFKHQLDPRDKDDALLDSDGDGVLNVDEYLIASNPQVAEEGLVALREDFEKPKRNYYWHHHGGPLWVLDQTKASQGKSSFRTPLIKGGQKTYLETEIYSSGGPLRFDYLLSPHVGNWLELRVDGKQWLSQWSPETEKGFTTFERYLEPGRHVIKWTFKKDGRYNKSEGFVWLDNIFLPAPSDSDQDGAADGWEYRFFDSLDADLSTDPDNDGLTSIEEAKCHCTPHLRDGDRDGMPDPWEFKHQLDPRDKDDALLDSDGDGVLNVDEYLIASNPQVAEEGLVALREDFEKPKRNYYWHHHGGPLWVLDQTKASQGKSSFRTPLIKGGQKTYLETEIYSSGGPLRFDYLLSPHVGNWLELRVDGKQWLSQWSPETEKGFTTFERYLEPGRHVIKWTFKKDGRYNKSEGFVWLDNIFLPSNNDFDQDGVLDGWEYHYFNKLDHDLNQDSDEDGVTDFDEFQAGSDPTDALNGNSL